MLIKDLFSDIIMEAPHISVGSKVIDFEFEAGRRQGLARLVKVLLGLEVEDKYGNVFKLKDKREKREFTKKLLRNAQIKKELGL